MARWNGKFVCSDSESASDVEEDDDWGSDWMTAINLNSMSRQLIENTDVSSAVTGKQTSKNESESVNALVPPIIQLNDNKAGMTGLDRDKINKIIEDASKGSRFYENEQRKQKQILARMEEQKVKARGIGPKQLAEGLRQADTLLDQLECGRDLSRTIVHVDMDAFYAAVEMRDRPETRDKPMAVGCSSMLSTSNYMARRYGVRAAMPGFIAKKLCPQLIIITPNFEKYAAVSAQVRGIFSEYDCYFCTMSLDEAYLDITEHLKRRSTMTESERTFSQKREDTIDFGDAVNSGDPLSASCDSGLVADGGRIGSRSFGCSAWDAVEELRFRIHAATQLTASAGIASNMMLAKVCSDMKKPNGQYQIPNNKEAIMEFINDLPIRKICGIGKVTESLLSALDVHQCRDLRPQRGLLYHLFSPVSFGYFMRICLGIGSTRVESDAERKSISVERTFAAISCRQDMVMKCNELCEALVQDLRSERIKGKTVTIKLKTIDFDTRTRAQTLSNYTMDYEPIYRAACNLLESEIRAADEKLQLRLMGVRLSNFQSSKSPEKSRTQVTLPDLFHKRPPAGAGGEADYVENKQSGKIKSAINHRGIDSLQSCDMNPVANVAFDTRICLKYPTATESPDDGDVYDADTDVNESECESDCEAPIEPGYAEPSVRCNELEKASVGTCCNEDVRVTENRKARTIAVCIDANLKKNNKNDNSLSKDSGEEKGSVAHFSGSCSSPYVCPICSEEVDCVSLNGFNRHIDSCLSNRADGERCGRAMGPDLVSKKTFSSKKGIKARNGSDRQVTLGASFRFSCGQYSAQGAGDITANLVNSDMPISTTNAEFQSDLVVACESNNTAQPSNVSERTIEENEVSGMEQLVCPICGRKQLLNDLELFNRHIDTCLMHRPGASSRKRKSSQTQNRGRKKKKARTRS